MTAETNRNILLIDDDTSLLVTLRDFLSFENYNVVTAESGEKGLQRLEEMTPGLIILDMSMPGMGGIGFLKAITSPDGHPKYPVLVLTARSNMAEFFADVEVDGFIAKPCKPDDLLMEVGRIMFLRSGSSAAESGVSTVLEKKRVLLGEDDPSVGEKLSKAFAKAGYVVDSVQRGPDVLEKAIVGCPDLIVLKLALSGMNGAAVADLLKEMNNTRKIPVLIYDDTGAGSAKSKVSAVGSMVRAVVESADAEELVETAGRILAD